MYSHCIFCKNDLGRNEAIEKFQVGRRLAFDAERGRLWVICKNCSRWNLTPLEERWEAIEDCERQYRATHTRVSTENIGLARLPDGTDLIRIGQPQLPEFAAWRYGETLMKRRRKHIILIGAGVAVVAAAVVSPLAGLGVPVLYQIPTILNGIRSARTVARVKSTGGHEHRISRASAFKTELESYGVGWGLNVKTKARQTLHLEGEPALRAATMLLPHINSAGANREQVQRAVKHVQSTLTTDQLFMTTAQQWSTRAGKATAPLGKTPPEIRLALEMATHESQERRALEGELAELDAMWREAEEIASIADDLLLPARIVNMFKR